MEDSCRRLGRPPRGGGRPVRRLRPQRPEEDEGFDRRIRSLLQVWDEILERVLHRFCRKEPVIVNVRTS